MLEFRKEYGTDVATVTESADQIVEVLRRKDGLFDLTIHRGNEETGRWDDMTAVLKPDDFIRLGTVADHTLCQEPECPSFEKPPSRGCKCHPRNAP